jgi:hypothetical protein
MLDTSLFISSFFILFERPGSARHYNSECMRASYRRWRRAEHLLLKSIHFGCRDKLLRSIDSAQPHTHFVAQLRQHRHMTYMLTTNMAIIYMTHTLRPECARMRAMTTPARTGKKKRIRGK